MGMNKKRFLGLVLIVISILSFFAKITITGDVIGPSYSSYLSLISILGFILGVVLVISKLTQIIITDRTNDFNFFRKKAEDANNNEKVHREMNHLVSELSRGNLQAGLGTPGHVPGTSIFYLRGRNGARLFYRQNKNGYEIVAQADKNNENRVIDRVRQEYDAT